jgi:anaerobic selenocysteine-containing dehydrogenase
MNWCSVEVETEGDQVLGIHGNRENPIYEGYRCAKGAAQRHLYGHPDRLLHSLERQSDGSFRKIPAEEAFGRIADRLRPILEGHGPRSLAFYWGTYHLFDSIVNFAFSDGFMRAVGSPMTFNPMTIDQPGKPISKALHGVWMAPDQSTLAPKAALLVGTNPVVSHQGRLGSPARLLRRFEEWGTQLIVIDPRRTETARRAALHLQPRPGSDVPILAGIIRVILEEGGHDHGFLAEHAVGLDALRDAVAPFTPDRVAELADVAAEDVVEAARLWYRAGRGYGYVGTGRNMSGGGRGTLVEYLVLCLHTLCGYWSRGRSGEERADAAAGDVADGEGAGGAANARARHRAGTGTRTHAVDRRHADSGARRRDPSRGRRADPRSDQCRESRPGAAGPA